LNHASIDDAGPAGTDEYWKHDAAAARGPLFQSPKLFPDACIRVIRASGNSLLKN
jgi:hypothetical protein